MAESTLTRALVVETDGGPARLPAGTVVAEVTYSDGGRWYLRARHADGWRVCASADRPEVSAEPECTWVRDRFGNVLGLTLLPHGWRDHLGSDWRPVEGEPGRWATRFNAGVEAPSFDELNRLAAEALGPGARVEPRPASGLVCDVIWPDGTRAGCSRFGALDLFNDRIRRRVA